jgi:hypothetical protein
VAEHGEFRENRGFDLAPGPSLVPAPVGPGPTRGLRANRYFGHGVKISIDLHPQTGVLISE